MRIRLSALVLALLLVATGASAQGTIQIVKLHAASLEGNLLGDPAEQEVAVYLPPGYATSTARYPVLYLLHGIGGGFTDWTKHWGIRESMDGLIASGAAPFLVVMPNGRNSLGGGFYVDSPVSGGWESFLVRELVPRIDADFRTVAARESRGIAGHSMGGFGALRLGMRHPDLFASLYAMSPCCLDLTDDIGHGNQDWKKALRFREPADLGKAIQAGDFYPVAMIAMAAAITPNREKPPFFVDLPVREVRGELLPDDAVYEQWRAALPFSQLAAHRAGLLRMRGIVIDYGTSDQFAHIITSTPELSRELARLRIPHRLDVYAGDHRQQIPERLRTHVLPFFATVLPAPK
jgi:S-formylglutathione hydrolase